MNASLDNRWFTLDSNNIKVTKVGEDKALFRIVPFDILLQMLSEKTITLVNTYRWDDVYENFIMKYDFVEHGKRIPVHLMEEKFYGLCWSSKMNSDALWRIYSSDKKSVRIKTTVGKIFRSIPKESGDGVYLFGKVDYYSQTKIENDLKSVKTLTRDQLASLLLQSFFVKRKSFSHESEYRLIYMSDNLHGEINGIKQLPIDPLSFIENIYFDPRVDDSYVRRCTKVIVDCFGYPKKKVHKSSLYSFRPQIFELE
ncbi:MAG: DUF2971 domain-containing protein [Bacteroidales bacterium]|nr:DUF2971 domain-containing protein [Bacteroidales bacterium]